MTSAALVVDVSRDWAIACDVQQRFMHGDPVESLPGIKVIRITDFDLILAKPESSGWGHRLESSLSLGQ